MNELRVITRGKIQDGKLDQFRALAQACMERVREKGKDILQYDWFFNENYTECVVIERFVDSDAVLDHIANLGNLLGDFVGVFDKSTEVFGAPSEELMKATDGMEITVYSHFQGL